MRKLQFLAILLLLLAACGKPPILPPVSTQFQKGDYPLTVGNWWRYQVYDSINRTTDTLTLKIISKNTTGSVTQYHCELYEKGNIVDSGYYNLSDTSIEYNTLKHYSLSYFGFFQFNIPFKKGDKWKSSTSNSDTTIVSNRSDTSSILGRPYSPSYTINTTITDIREYYLYQKILVSPKIGLIYQSVDLFNSPERANQVFQLIDYQLN